MLTMLTSNTRLRIASVLAIIWIFYLILHFNARAFFFPLLSVIMAVFFDLLITYLRKRRWYLPTSSLVTGFLIGLILPTNSPWPLLLAAFIAVFSKQFIRIREHQHLFNPAALGIFVTSLLTGVPVAWWAVSWTPWVIPIIIGVSYTLYQLKRLWLPLTFLALYALYRATFVEFESLISSLLDGTLFLFVFIMLPEPITSPANKRWRYLFGPLVGLFVILLERVGAFVLPDLFLPALLIGNIIGFLAKRSARA